MIRINRNIFKYLFKNRTEIIINSTNKLTCFILLLFTCPIIVKAQPYFKTERDTFCFDDLAKFENKSTPIDGSKYYWDFCAPDLTQKPQSKDVLIPTPNTINGAAFISAIEVPGGVFAFVTNFIDGTLTRLFFTDFNNAPIVENLGYIGLDHPEGIKIIQNIDGSYYGFIVGGENPNYHIARLNFPSGLSQPPTIDTISGIGSYLNIPMGISIQRGTDYWIAFITNNGSNTITQLSFGNGLNQPPTGEIKTIGGIGLNGPIGIQIINDKGIWYGFVSNSGNIINHSYSITRFTLIGQLGSEINKSLVNNLTDMSLQGPFDISFFQNCNEIYGYVLNSYGKTSQISFDGSLNKVLSFKSIDMDALSNPHGISELFRLNNSINALVTHTATEPPTNPLSRIYYESPCDEALNLWSTKTIPDPFKYPNPTPKEYNVSLEQTNKITGLKSYYCRSILVAPNPPHLNIDDKIICLGNLPQQIHSDSINDNPFGYENIDNRIYRYKTERVFTNKYECTFKDTFLTTNYYQHLHLRNVDTIYGTPVVFDAGNNFSNYKWSTNETTSNITVNKAGNYVVTVSTDTANCMQSDTGVLKYHLDLPNYITPNSSVNKRWVIPLLASFPNADIRIYDRIGNLVAAYKGSDQGWDGTCNGRPLSADGYWYYIDLHNGDKVFKGSISIIR